ncbi:MAG: hypothetical protein P1U56_25155 [Saprospiraceae bacterium]|nr:hypothetical protein [Saprospiraceae bacterium]
MKICRNCATINTPEATSCIKCSMKGMLVEAPNEEKKPSALKAIYHTCTNCGTTDTGKGSHCQQCRFPLPQSKKEQQESEIIKKAKRS